MPICTYLDQYDCTEETSDDELNSLLADVREATGDDWRIRESEYEVHRWFRRPLIKRRYTLYRQTVGSEFQIMNFYRPDLVQLQSINTVNGAEHVAAYLYGVLAGVKHAD